MPFGSYSSKGKSRASSTVDEMPPHLRRALSLLHLRSLDQLEEHFLSTDAFLEAWSTFRDSVLFLEPEAISRPTLVDATGLLQGGITRGDILWFFTNFDEDVLRYDARADPDSKEYTTDMTVHGAIDKRHWTVREYEKHLYAWLLQSFDVSKSVNPYGFKYLELRSLVTAWEDIFVPIMDAVRASYSVKGRRHYGRLATFIEDRAPSRLAFPQSNVASFHHGEPSSAPFRLLSRPKLTIHRGSEDQGDDRLGSIPLRDLSARQEPPVAVPWPGFTPSVEHFR